ncbi:MAG TPA: trypsin-like peptidase domain-containing protein, partial [Dehalococcoidia bacterium]
MSGGRVPRTAIGTASAILALSVAVFGGWVWGQTSAPVSSRALAAGPTVSTTAGTSWVTQVAETARAAVVSVAVNGASTSRGGVAAARLSGSGTGVLLDAQGDILTNDHVITLDGSSRNGSIQVGLANGRTVAAQIVGEDTATDL